MVELLADPAPDATRTGPNEVRIDPRRPAQGGAEPGAVHARSAPRSCSRRRCWRARPLPAAAPGRRRDRPAAARHPPAGLPLPRCPRELDRASSWRWARLRGAPMFLDEASVTATENAIMAAVLAEGETTIGNAACEPHVQDLCRFLVGLGARIDGIGSNLLRIEGVERARRRRAHHRHRPHRGGQLRRPGRGHRRRAGGRGRDRGRPAPGRARLQQPRARPGSWTPDRLRVPRDQDLRSRTTSARPIPKIDDGPWPAFPGRPDLDRGRGRHAGAGHGADLREDVRDPAVLRGQAGRRWGRGSSSATPTGWSSTAPPGCTGERLESPDIRAGMALLLAALCADGESIIRNIGQIDRGYERIDERPARAGGQHRACRPVSGARLVAGTGGQQRRDRPPGARSSARAARTGGWLRSRAGDRPG